MTQRRVVICWFCLTIYIATAYAASAQGQCPEYVPTNKYRTTSFTDYLNTTTSVSPRRPKADVPLGDWIRGRATFYGADEKLDASRVACGEPKGQFGIIEYGSCGYTNSDGSLPFPREVYAAVADTNEDYPGSCGRCYQVGQLSAMPAMHSYCLCRVLHSRPCCCEHARLPAAAWCHTCREHLAVLPCGSWGNHESAVCLLQVRCRTGFPYNNGRPLRVSDLVYYRPYSIKDNAGRPWPGNNMSR